MASADPKSATAAALPAGTPRALQGSLVSGGNASGNLNRLVTNQVALAVAKGSVSVDRASTVANNVSKVMVNLMARGVSQATATEMAQKVISAEHPAPKNPVLAAARSLMSGGNASGTSLTALAGAKSPAGAVAADKSVVAAMLKGTGAGDVIKAAQLAVKTAESFVKADSSPQASLANNSSVGARAAAGPIANASPEFQKSLSAMVTKGLSLNEAMQRADQASGATSQAASADTANPSVGLARGLVTAPKDQSSTDSFEKVLGASMAKGGATVEALARAAEANVFEQKATEADARNPLAGISKGSAPPASSNPGQDLTYQRVIASGGTPAEAEARATKAVASVPSEIQSPGRALASGQNVRETFSGNSRIYDKVLNNALQKGLPVVEARSLALKAEERSAFRTGLPVDVAAAANRGRVTVTTQSGQALPGWLKYDPAAKGFVAHDVPLGALPLSIVVTIDGKPTTVVIAEQPRPNLAAQVQAR